MPRTDPTTGESQDRLCEALAVEGLSVALGDFRIKDLSFRVDPGCVTVLLGHNGAGKTTTLRVIMGMIRKDSGTVRIGALDHVRDEREFKQHVGFVPEEGYFYARMTAAEYLSFVAGFYPRWNPACAAELTTMLNLPLGKPLGEFSKGMRTKAALVAALSHDPDVLLLDEPTSGLDPRSRVDILDCLQTAAHSRGRAVLFSTHNLHEADEIGDYVILLDKGRILADQPLARLRANSSGPWSLESFYLESVR
jgi:ABC-2 type transport system ATP-binding protein